MGIYQKIRELWKKPKQNELYKQRLIQWRKQSSTVIIDRPTRLDRARSLGYKAKQGVIVVRQRVVRGGHTRPKIRHGRRSKHFGQRMSLRKSYKLIAEERAQRGHKNLTVLNSYLAGTDGKQSWYEIIMLNYSHPAITNDKDYSFVAKKKHRSRVFHGKTSAGRKMRGLRDKGAEKARPSRRANKRLM